MQIGYKKKLYRDYRSGVSVDELAGKYKISVFKVNLIIEKEEIRSAEQTSTIQKSRHA